MSAFYRFAAVLLAVLVTFLAPTAHAAAAAGSVETVKGAAWAQLGAEAPRRLEKGAPFYVTDVIRTEPNAAVKLKFADETVFFLGADAELAIEKFSYQDPAQDNGFASRLAKGTFRFVTGLIAAERPEAMEVSTSVATIGIRGTNVAGKADATSATVILMEPEGDPRPTAIVVANQYGSVTINQPGYGTDVPDQFSPPSPPRRMRLDTINSIMRSLQSVQRINIPQPRMR
jgi:hypothetical protein